MDPLVTDHKRELRELTRQYREIMDRVSREVSIMEERNDILRSDIDSNLVAQQPNGKALPGIIPPTE